MLIVGGRERQFLAGTRETAGAYHGPEIEKMLIVEPSSGRHGRAPDPRMVMRVSRDSSSRKPKQICRVIQIDLTGAGPHHRTRRKSPSAITVRGPEPHRLTSQGERTVRSKFKLIENVNPAVVDCRLQARRSPSTPAKMPHGSARVIPSTPWSASVRTCTSRSN